MSLVTCLSTPTHKTQGHNSTPTSIKYYSYHKHNIFRLIHVYNWIDTWPSNAHAVWMMAMLLSLLICEHISLPSKRWKWMLGWQALREFREFSEVWSVWWSELTCMIYCKSALVYVEGWTIDFHVCHTGCYCTHRRIESSMSMQVGGWIGESKKSITMKYVQR